MKLESVKKILKSKQDLTFLALGILMSILVFSYIFYSIDFLTLRVKDVLNAEKGNKASSVNFNIDKIKALQIDNMQK
jgi:hypothetical protein